MNIEQISQEVNLTGVFVSFLCMPCSTFKMCFFQQHLGPGGHLLPSKWLKKSLRRKKLRNETNGFPNPIICILCVIYLHHIYRVSQNIGTFCFGTLRSILTLQWWPQSIFWTKIHKQDFLSTKPKKNNFKDTLRVYTCAFSLPIAFSYCKIL